MTIQPCDIFLTRGVGWLSRLIRVCSRSWGECATDVNHAGIFVDSGTLGTAVAVETRSKVLCHQLAGQYDESTQMAVFRPLNLSDVEKNIIMDRSLSYIDRPYGWLKIGAHLLDWLFFGRYVFRRLARLDDYPICSWVVASAYSAAGKDFGCNYGQAQPDDIWDFCVASPDKYELVRPLSPFDADWGIS